MSIQAGSTTDIDDLKVIDLDTDQVVYQNNFSTAGDAKRDLNLFYYPQGGKDTTDFSVDDQKKPSRKWKTTIGDNRLSSKWSWWV